MIDGIDRDIMSIIQCDARMSNAEIARRIGLAPSAVLERLRKLEERGVIRGYCADIDPREVDFGLTAFVSVRTDDDGSGLNESLAAIPEVLEVHDVAGDDCFLLKVRVKNTDDLGNLLREKIKPLSNVMTTRTTVVLHTFKETNTLPLKVNSEGRKRIKGNKGK